MTDPVMIVSGRTDDSSHWFRVVYAFAIMSRPIQSNFILIVAL